MYGAKRSKQEGGVERRFAQELPPYSKIFVSGLGTYMTPDDIQTMFDEYGNVEKVFPVRKEGVFHGKAFVKFSKRSAAAKAQDEVDGKVIDGRLPLKVVVASNRSCTMADLNNKLQRLFIKVNFNMDELTIREEFEKFGQVKEVTIVKHKDTGKPKGLAFVAFTNAYDAAIAMENCDKKFKPVYAEVREVERVGPKQEKPKNDKHDSFYDSGHSYPEPNFYARDSGYRENKTFEYNTDRRPPLLGAPRRDPPYGGADLDSNMFPGERIPGPTFQPDTAPVFENPMNAIKRYPAAVDSTRLIVELSGVADKVMIHRLFDVIPGLDYCDVIYDHGSRMGSVHVKYDSPQSAAYARDKWNGFEYPPGHPMKISFK